MKRGYPRPLTKMGTLSSNPKSDGPSYGSKWDNRMYPHPYATEEYGVANISDARVKECVYFKKCLHCGEPVKEEVVGLILFNPKSKVGFPFRDFLHKESGPFHFKCLNQSMRLCPHLATNKRFMAGTGEWKVVRKIIINEYLTRW